MKLTNRVAWQVFGTSICVVDRRERQNADQKCMLVVDESQYQTVVEVAKDGALQTVRGGNRVTVAVAGECQIEGVRYTRVVVREAVMTETTTANEAEKAKVLS
jgi:hypothetical protein